MIRNPESKIQNPKSKVDSHWSVRRKIILTLALLFAMALAILAFVIPRLVDVDRYRPEAAAEIEKATGKRAEIGHLSLSVVPTVAIRVDDFALDNPPGFPEGRLLAARRIDVEVDAAALWRRQVVIKALQLEQPAVHALSDVRGHRNFDSPNPPRRVADANGDPPGRFARVSLESSSGFSLGIISRIKIRDGLITDGTLLPSGQLGPTFFEADGMAAQLENVDLSAFTSPAPGGPTPRTTQAADLRKQVCATLRSAAAWETSLAYAASPSAGSPGEGTFEAEVLRFGDVRATSIKANLRLGYRQVAFDNLRFDFYKGRGAGSLLFNFAEPITHYSAEGQFHDVDLARLLADFPKAQGKMTGTMEGNLTFAGEVSHAEDPLAAKHGKGQVIVRNGQLPTLRLNSNLMLLARFSDFGPASGDPSSFSSISADLNLANDRITSQTIKILGNGVNIDAAGTLTFVGEGSLEYEGVAEVRAAQNALTNMVAGLSGAKFADGKLSFPFTLGGTLDNPRFRLKGAGAATGAAGAGPVQPGVVEGIIDLFKKKK
jgi:uncharacterized protein involved in outer membrane biogenesis